MHTAHREKGSVLNSYNTHTGGTDGAAQHEPAAHTGGTDGAAQREPAAQSFPFSTPSLKFP